MRRAAACAAAAALLLLAGCASVPLAPSNTRAPTAAEHAEVQRSLVGPYLACMRAEARRLGAADAATADRAELACGHSIQALRRYGAQKPYDPLQWSGFIEQVEREGRAAAGVR